MMFDPVFRRLHLLLILGGLLLGTGTKGEGQIPKALPASPQATASATAAPSPQSAAAELKELKAKLAAVQNELSSLMAVTDSGTGSVVSDAALEQRELLSQIIRSYTRHINALGALENEVQRHNEIQQETTSWKGFPNPPPYSIRMVDGLRESLQTNEQYAQTARSTRVLMENAFADAQTAIQSNQAKLRLVNVKLENDGKSPAEVAQLTNERDLLELRVRSRKAWADMLQCELKLAAAREENLKAQADLFKRQILEASQHEQFTQSDLDKINAAIAVEGRKLDKEMQRVIAQGPAAQKALAEARQNLSQAQQNAAASATDEQKAKLSQLQELVEVRRIQAETIELCEEQLQQLQQFQNMEQAGWQLRYYVFNNDETKTQEARTKLAATVNRVKILQNYYQEQMAVNSREISDLEDYLRNDSTPPAASLKVAQDKLDSFRTRDEYFKRVVVGLGKLERQGQRWEEETNLKDGELTPQLRVVHWYAGLGGLFSHAWNYEIYRVVDPGFPGGLRPITVETVLTALFILLAGYFLCRWLSRKFQQMLTKWMHMDTNLAGIFRGWIMFFLSLGVVMIAMEWVKIPLTAFAFLGGALAIGLGFGTQNLLKNFISGIMLLAERPLRLGDLVEVGSSRGRVVNIGIRSSVIRNSDGIETLIPNSSFLESNVTNWTYSNPQVRFKIRVRVSYNTSSREVADLLTEVVEGHGKVFTNPKPQVLLDEFTDNGMAFIVYYWLEPLKCDAAAIASDLRFMIEKRLTEAGIMMA